MRVREAFPADPRAGSLDYILGTSILPEVLQESRMGRDSRMVRRHPAKNVVAGDHSDASLE